MKAEERARRAFQHIYGRIVEDMDKDVIAAWTAAIREAEQQARNEALTLAADICDKQADEWDSDNVQTYKNYAAYCAASIRMLIDRDTRPKQYGCHCDLEPHMTPDGCVFDEGRPQDCSMTRLITRKEECKYWKLIEREGGE